MKTSSVAGLLLASAAGTASAQSGIVLENGPDLDTGKARQNGGDFHDFLLGASVPLRQGKLLASYVKKQDRSATQRGGRQLAVGYTYTLSKRTNLYSSFGTIRNELAATNVVGDASSGGSAPAAGDGSRALSVGIQHKF